LFETVTDLFFNGEGIRRLLRATSVLAKCQTKLKFLI